MKQGHHEYTPDNGPAPKLQTNFKRSNKFTEAQFLNYKT